MLLGELMTVVQEKLPIKVVLFDNGKLGFIDIEQKSEGMLPLYTGLQNPDFGKPRASECQGRYDDTRDAAEDRVGFCVRNGPVFSESHAARAVRRTCSP